MYNALTLYRLLFTDIHSPYATEPLTSHYTFRFILRLDATIPRVTFFLQPSILPHLYVMKKIFLLIHRSRAKDQMLRQNAIDGFFCIYFNKAFFLFLYIIGWRRFDVVTRLCFEQLTEGPAAIVVYLIHNKDKPTGPYREQLLYLPLPLTTMNRTEQSIQYSNF